MLNLNSFELYEKLKCSYIGNVDYEPQESWGEYIYLEVYNTISKTLVSQLRNHEWYAHEYDPTPNTIMFAFRPDKHTREKILKPFTRGEYSKIDRDYVNRYYDYWLEGGTRPLNWQIFYKSPELRQYWHNQINPTDAAVVQIPEDAELWSKPMKQDEIYGYLEHKVIHYEEHTVGKN